jgi:hypothetical protein
MAGDPARLRFGIEAEFALVHAGSAVRACVSIGERAAAAVAAALG